MSSDVLIVYCTLPQGEAATGLVRTVVHERLVACVNMIPEVRSLYRWKGEVHDDPEVLAIMKTTAARFDALRARIVELHPYECPEVIAAPVTAGHAPYMEWVAEMTTAEPRE